MKTRLLAWGALVVLIFSIGSCSSRLDPGFYCVKGKYAFSGILQVNDDHDRSAVFYQNENQLFAQPVTVSPRRHSLRFMDGRKVKVSVRQFKAPEFQTPSGKPPYREAKYRVRVDSAVYAHAKGYWTSYSETNESFGRIYVNKFFTIVGGKIRKAIRKVISQKSQDLTMDIYIPEDGNSTQRPLLLLIHGGAFFNGDKAGVDSDMVRFATYFASLGYVVSSINYRLGYIDTKESEKAGYRALQDAHAAIRFLLQTDSPNLNINPRLVFVAGEDAGAITALNLAYMTDKYRPESTRGVLWGHVGNEGPIDKIAPAVPDPKKKSFQIRGVGNLWGAVSDTMMLQSAEVKVPVISFHSEDDMTVPFGIGYPFQYVARALDKINGIMEIGEVLINWLFFGVDLIEIPDLDDVSLPEMYGSSIINRILQRKGIHSEIYPFKGDRHRVHLKDMKIDSANFDFIRDKLAAFFSSEMVVDPVTIVQDSKDKQLFYIKSPELKAFYCKVDGGFIIDKVANKVWLLLKSDAPVHSLTVCGLYRSGLAFHETFNLD